jgi:hypothetical protein
LLKSRQFLIIFAIPVLVVLLLAGGIVFTRLLVIDSTIPLPRFPEEIQIYEMIKPNITAEYVAALGIKFGLKGAVKQNGAFIGVQDEQTKASLAVNADSGYIEYDTPSMPWVENSVLPTFEEAKTIARDFLNQAGLLRSGMKYCQAEVGMSRGATPQELHVLVTSLTNELIFPGIQSVDSSDILLPGGQSNVVIGSEGKVIRMSFHPIQCIPSQTTRIKPVDQAYRELKASVSKNMFTGDRPISIDRLAGPHWISINSITVSYFLDSASARVGYVYPGNVFKGQSSFFIGANSSPFAYAINATDLFEFPIRVPY